MIARDCLAFEDVSPLQSPHGVAGAKQYPYQNLDGVMKC
jgi:hypothetical protein